MWSQPLGTKLVILAATYALAVIVYSLRHLYDGGTGQWDDPLVFAAHHPASHLVCLALVSPNDSGTWQLAATQWLIQ